MALTTEQLEAARTSLQSAMYKGLRSVSYQDRRTEYASVEEMRLALSDLESQIAATSGVATVRRSYAAFSK